MTNAISVMNLTKSFGDVEALKGVSFFVEEGTVCGLLGPNGAGKTTAIRILTTLIQPSGGYAKVQGFDVVHDAQQVREVMGLTGQSAAVDEQLTGTENLRMIGKLNHMQKSHVKARAEELLHVFDLEDAAKRTVKTYSGGMRRRLDLAASLVSRPPVLFLDEPTTGLDPKSRLALWGIIEGLVAGGTTLLLTTQYLEEADRLADNLIIINDGLVIEEGHPDDLKVKHGKDNLDEVFLFLTEKDDEDE